MFVATLISICGFALILAMMVRFQKRRLAAFHRAFTNRLTVQFASRLPGFGIVINIGRKSGTIYRTPVNVFWLSEGFIIALTYGRDSGWVKNVLAAGDCQIKTGGAVYQLFDPVVVHDPSRRRFPFLVRLILGLINANDYLQVSQAQKP